CFSTAGSMTTKRLPFPWSPRMRSSTHTLPWKSSSGVLTIKSPQLSGIFIDIDPKTGEPIIRDYTAHGLGQLQNFRTKESLEKVWTDDPPTRGEQLVIYHTQKE